MNRELLELATDLHRRHRPYVVATVVWARGPSSGKQGGTALIEADGTVHGWIGGACAEPAVVREARRVIKDGEPLLLYLGPADELDGAGREGVVTVPISCSSEGALEVFFTPVQMKKNRPGILLTALASDERLEPVCRFLLRETTTIGLRYHRALRWELEREVETVETAFGRVGLKIARLDDGPARVSPEYEDCRRCSLQHGVTVEEVRREALRVYHSEHGEHS